MSLYDYEKSKEILSTDPTFASLIMAAAKKAGTKAFGKLQATFPRIMAQYKRRCHAPGGYLDGDHVQLIIHSKGKVHKYRRTLTGFGSK